jgi:phage terminase large subunit-like protein
MRAQRMVRDGAPVLEWCIGNVVGRYDARSNVYPRKERPEQKIDAAITTIMGIARCLAGRQARSRYNDPATRTSPFLTLAPAADYPYGRSP